MPGRVFYIAEIDGDTGFQDVTLEILPPRQPNVILNFLRLDKEVGNFLDKEFEQNGWHIIDVSSLKDAKNKLSQYLNKSKVQNLYINAHGLLSDCYIYDDEGNGISDSTGMGINGFKSYPTSGFSAGEGGILGGNIVQYIKNKNVLSRKNIEDIEDFIEISKSVEIGKNLIIAGCFSARYDDLGIGITTLINSIDVFINKDFSSIFYTGSKGKEYIPFTNFVSYNQTSAKNSHEGWRQYQNGKIVRRLSNIKITKYGVKTL
ncbi:hypothetical protein ACM39_11600 [Chryseobacterium sp. FH2]|uniref:hypothetical protein n=1 Tax=Chryseobacterium sp. FH2 TaxID=1674291 RepID=UPI00065AAFCF|nr:hypothetical protein [Chryseobacterium sp. FH2]KMQ67969.1 hypothetical protein ACM39_11600 [Chryseobacterium sp. FH2]